MRIISSTGGFHETTVNHFVQEFEFLLNSRFVLQQLLNNFCVTAQAEEEDYVSIHSAFARKTPTAYYAFHSVEFLKSSFTMPLKYKKDRRVPIL